MADSKGPSSPDELRMASSVTPKPKGIQRLGLRAALLAVGIAGVLAAVILLGVYNASSAQSGGHQDAAPVVASAPQSDSHPPSDITEIPPDRLPADPPQSSRMHAIRTVPAGEANATPGYAVRPGQDTPILSATLPPNTPNLETTPTYPDQVQHTVGPVGTAPTGAVHGHVDIAQSSEADAARQAQMQAADRKRQEAQDARTSDMVMRPSEPPTTYTPNTGVANATLPRGAAFTGDSVLGQTTTSVADQATKAQIEKLAFLSAASSSGMQDYLPTTQQEPISPYTIVAGSVIPVALVTGITTDIPGEIVARLRKDMYDSRSGRFCLAPKGATLIAEPDTRVVTGQARVVAAFTRIIFPDTSSQDIPGFSGADLNGYSGLSGKAITHLNRILGRSVLEAVLGSVVGRLSAGSGTTVTTGNASNVGSTIVNDTDQALEGTAPTIEIQEGYRFNVIVNRDWVLRGPWSGGCAG